MNVIFTDGTKENFETVMQNVLEKAMQKIQTEKMKADKVYTINQVAKRLNMAHSTVSKYVKEGRIKSTSDGKITERAINEYLGNI